MQVVTQKLDLGQTSMAHMLIERHIRDQTQISVADFSLDDSDNIFEMPQEFPSGSLDITLRSVCFSSRVGLTLIIHDAC